MKDVQIKLVLHWTQSAMKFALLVFLAGTSVLCSARIIRFDAFSLSSEGSDLIATKHSSYSSHLHTLVQNDSVALKNKNLSLAGSFDEFPHFGLSLQEYGALVPGRESLILLSFGSGKDSPRVVWKKRLPCSPLKLYRNYDRILLVCVKANLNRVTLYEVLLNVSSQVFTGSR